MDLPLLFHQTAVQIGEQQHRVCDLLEGSLSSAPRIAAARLADGILELELSDGRTATRSAPTTASTPPKSLDLVLKNAHQVLTLADDEGVGLRENVTIACADGRIVGIFEKMADCPIAIADKTRVLELDGCILTPGLVDPHTHPVFAGQRCVEFGLKARGASYLEIHKAGGGIYSTVEATRQASFEVLEQACLENLTRLLRWGVTTCEGKSGYALTVEGELRLLEAMRSASNRHVVDVVPTLLGAHTLPKELRERREDYIALICEQMIPQAKARDLALFCDAYCEDGAFTVDEVRSIFAAATDAGLGLRLHAEQFTNQGGAKLAAELGAASADHLEAIDDVAIDALARSETTAVVLPGAALTCNAPWPPVRALIDAKVPVALGTDLNPGSSMTASLPLMMSLACMQMQLSCEHAWRAVTVNAARSLGRDDIGLIAPGCQADFAIFSAPDYRYIPYHYGENHLRAVIKRGQLVFDRVAGSDKA
jgi:imidazolonepropionase